MTTILQMRIVQKFVDDYIAYGGHILPKYQDEHGIISKEYRDIVQALDYYKKQMKKRKR